MQNRVLLGIICTAQHYTDLDNSPYNTHMCVYLGLEDEASTFFVFLLTLILTSIAASGVALIVGALVNVIVLANIIAAFIYIFMLVSRYSING